MKNTGLFASLLLVFLICSSCENEKIQPGFTQGSAGRIQEPAHTTSVETREINYMYEAIGTIRPLTESIIESQVSAQVLKVFCVPGAAVQKGQVLVRLDARRLTTRLKQAKEGLSLAQNNLKQTYKSMDEAKAGLDQASSAYKRSQKLFGSGIISSHQMEIDRSAFLQAKARLEKAQEGELSAKASIRNAQEVVKEAGIALDYSKILSPADGVVVKRKVDPGDIAVPGKPLLVIQTSGALRLEAHVREGLISHVNQGGKYQVKITTLNKQVFSNIEEVVPYADPATRTFLVKASLPDTPGVYPGMFGRLLIPVEKAQTLLIPQKAVSLVGQLELVLVKQGSAWQRVYIKTGKTFDNDIEVLSGLTGNETIGYSE